MSRAVFKPYKPPAVPGSTAALVARTFLEIGGPKSAAIELGVSKSSVYRYADQDAGRPITYDQVRKLVSGGARAPVFDFAALAGGHFVPGGVPRESLLRLMAMSSREHGELVARVLSALEDRKITPDERAELAFEFDGLVAILVGARNRLTKGRP